ncbi:phage tail spike protein [Lacticaseibacillus sp. N501-2]|uniref:phage tail spike protein n=1 Tax=Lacticaseibacillus salsurae TaxID=3367729 RepID=UPI0038B3D6D2
MIPTLYEATTTSFNDNGLGALPELYDAEVVEKANDILELTATYPVSGQRYDDLIEDAIILAKPNSRDDEHAFRISDLELDITGENVTITAYSITNDLGSNLITDLAISDADGQTAMTNLQNAVQSDTHFEFASDITTKSSTHFQMVSPLEAIAGTTGSLLQIWGGEIKRENDRISLLARRGYDDVTTFRLGKNISGLKYAIDTSSVVTRIYPYYSKTVDGGTSLIRGATVDSKYIGNYPYVHIKPVDASQEITVTEDMTDKQIVAAIDGWAKDWFTKSANTGVDKPSVTISLDVLELSGSSELEGKLATLEQLGLFDTVTLFVPEYNIDVTAKVNELHYDPMARRVTSLVAGTVKTSVFSQQSNALSIVQAAVAEAKNQADYAAVSANGKNTNFYGDTEPFNPREGDIWYTTELIDGKKEDVVKTFTNGVWTELVTSATGRQIAHDVDDALVQLNADMSAADANLQVAKQDIADLQVKLKANDDTQAQLSKDVAANSTLITQNKADVDAALDTVNNTLSQAQTDTAQAVKNADLAVTNAQSAVEASGLATNTANAANDAASAAKQLATEVSNTMATVKSQAATAASDAADAISAANKAQGDATSALGNSNTAISNAKDALNKYNNLVIGARNYLAGTGEPWQMQGSGRANQTSENKWLFTFGTISQASFKDGEYVTVSFDYTSVGTGAYGTIQPQFNQMPWQCFNDVEAMKDNGHVVRTVQWQSGWTTSGKANGIQMRMDNVATTRTVTVYNMQFECGDKATDWSAAPEDVQQQFTDINGELANKVSQTTYNTLAGTVDTVSTLAKQNQSTIGTLATKTSVDTISQTVNDQATEIDQNSHDIQLKANQSTVDAVNQTVTTTKSLAEQTANGLTLKADTSVVDTINQTVKQQAIDIKAAQDQLALTLTESDLTKGLSGYATQTWAQNQITATAGGINETISNVQTQVNNSAVGTNLYTDTQNFDNLASWNGSVMWTKTTDTYKGLAVMQTTYDLSGLSQYIQVKKGDILTYSVYAKYTSGTGSSNISWTLNSQTEGSYSGGDVNSYWKTVTITDSWQRVSGTTVATSDGYLRPRLERTNLTWIIHRISKKQRNPTIHTGLRCFGVSPIGCAYMLRLSR